MKKRERERIQRRAVEVITMLATRYHYAAHSPADLDDLVMLSRMPSLAKCRSEHVVLAAEALRIIGPEHHYTDRWLADRA